jgi:hypothetical protein
LDRTSSTSEWRHGNNDLALLFLLLLLTLLLLLAADLDEHDLLDGDGTDDEDGWDLGAVLEFDMPPIKSLLFDVTLFPPSIVAPPDVKSGTEGEGAGAFAYLGYDALRA